MKTDFLKELSPVQKEAVLHLDSPLLVIAGAGSGKTKVITYKIAYLIEEKGFSPNHILGVTFTNKAAKEMKTRIETLTNGHPGLFNISTFHALGLKILREWGEKIGFNSRWMVMDGGDQKKIIGKIVAEDFDHLREEKMDQMVSKINHAKMNLCYPNDPIRLQERGFREDDIQVYTKYHAFQQKQNLWDFEDLISFPVRLLQNDRKLREHLASQYKYVVVDEFQDTNPNQYELVRLIAHSHQNITVVGDDDQAIYSWRGAKVHFLMEFEKDFPKTHTVKLEQNYRSTQPILSFANAIISRNSYRKPKSMWTEHKEGQPVFFLHSSTKEDEAQKVADLVEIMEEEAPDTFPLAILYRINSQSLNFEREFLKRNIPFRILKGHPFFDRKEIKDAMALIKLVFYNGDDLSFLRVIDSFPLGVGARSREDLSEYAKQHQLSLWDSLIKMSPEKLEKKKLLKKIESLSRQVEKMKISDVLNQFLSQPDYIEWLEKQPEKSRLMNVRELSDFIQKWEQENTDGKFEDFIDQINLDREMTDKKEFVRVFLLTMHNAKGLEFPTVFAAGVNSTFLPFFMRKEWDEIEEERRLFYVAATRAKKQLIISPGSERQSVFVSQIPSHLIKRIFFTGEIFESLNGVSEESPAIGSKKKQPDRFVEHPIFGEGRIVGEIDETKFLIDFGRFGEKLIDTSIVGIKFIE